jgi:hypothetical protein
MAGCWLLLNLKNLSVQRGLVLFLKGSFSEDCGWMDCCKIFVGQAARQLEFLLGKNQTEPNFDNLREAMAIVQHHDGVSGTEKQHVANDYVQRGRICRGDDDDPSCCCLIFFPLSVCLLC